MVQLVGIIIVVTKDPISEILIPGKLKCICLKDYVDISTISAAEVKEFVGRYCGNKIDSPWSPCILKLRLSSRAIIFYKPKDFLGIRIQG
ncbi:hypothetical protein CEXT_392241 [Caerostris extrusa]|uniref:Uncharacterized protein n=1 Tax=Caerostris extrusa TaxID=172846 RepID=A0AAV4WA18_CAEEX|nr:hypothetical protein CEXT_392241 [Caerostris extrusa]